MPLKQTPAVVWTISPALDDTLTAYMPQDLCNVIRRRQRITPAAC
jgi:hypothetical protein